MMQHTAQRLNESAEEGLTRQANGRRRKNIRQSNLIGGRWFRLHENAQGAKSVKEKGEGNAKSRMRHCHPDRSGRPKSRMQTEATVTLANIVPRRRLLPRQLRATGQAFEVAVCPDRTSDGKERQFICNPLQIQTRFCRSIRTARMIAKERSGSFYNGVSER